MTECYACARLAELDAENSQLRVRVDELTAKLAIVGGDKYHTFCGMTFDEIRELKAKVDELERENARLSSDELYLRSTLVSANGEVIS